MMGDLSEMLPCKFTPEGDNVEVDALCGTLTVPENWKDANSPLIALSAGSLVEGITDRDAAWQLP
jgi:hypothetical protein